MFKLEENDQDKLSFPEDLDEQLGASRPTESAAVEEPKSAEGEQEAGTPEVEIRSYSRMAAREKTSAGAPVRKGEGGAKAAFCYFGGWFTGLLIFMTEKENSFIRFHALQSLLWSVSALFVWLLIGVLCGFMGITLERSDLRILTVIPLILFFGWGLVNLGLWFFMMVKAFAGEWYKIPWLGDKAEELS